MTSLSGPEKFGLSDKAVLLMLSKLPNANKCMKFEPNITNTDYSIKSIIESLRSKTFNECDYFDKDISKLEKLSEELKSNKSVKQSSQNLSEIIARLKDEKKLYSSLNSVVAELNQTHF